MLVGYDECSGSNGRYFLPSEIVSALFKATSVGTKVQLRCFCLRIRDSLALTLIVSVGSSAAEDDLLLLFFADAGAEAEAGAEGDDVEDALARVLGWTMVRE